jgi:polyhydroxyalkanoate synthesis repressor PhaR
MAQSRRADKAQQAAAAGAGPRILKKYPNRRLYDTEISSYITLSDVKAMVLAGTAFEVRDAKTGEDLTRSILLQIILEEETGGVPMFSTSTLAQIIRFYGHAMQGMMGSYLEQNLQTFTDVQARLAEQSKGLYDPKLQSPELWTKFLSGQAPMVQNLMGNYLEQSRNIFMQMQEQLNKQAETIFPGTSGRAAPKSRIRRGAACCLGSAVVTLGDCQ